LNLTYSPRAFLWASLVCLALAGSACGSDEKDVTPSVEPSTDGDDDDDDKKDGAVAQCLGAETRACSCSSGSAKGKNACRSGKWSSICSGCPTMETGGGPSGNLCKGGYYKGNFSGTYNPGVFGFGIGPSQFQVMIDGKPLGEIPALAFTLTEESTSVGEFQTFSVGGGCMTGSAQAFGFIDNPFVARITGSLDCATGFFDGQLDGQYNLINTGAIFSFKGPLTAQFELPQQLTDGDWVVAEPDALLGGSQGGGMGTWAAEWDADDAPASDIDPCAAIPLGDGGVALTPTPDAGTGTSTPPRSDAGVTKDGGV
jgi:hypothetical protein